MSQPKIEAGILGATGMVGQHFIRFLQDHPWFHLTWLGASDRSAGRIYKDAAAWHLGGETPVTAANQTVQSCHPGAGAVPKLLFSAMDAFAEAGHIVVSNSRNHRMEADVPLLVPEVNPDHLRLLETQGRLRGWKGRIVTNPNCSTVVLTMALAPLRPFGITRVLATTMQAISGAGYPGVSSIDINANVVPYIGGEEEKMQQETRKILGRLENDRIRPLEAQVSAQCNRVPVMDGHLVAVSLELAAKPSLDRIREALATFRGAPQERNLPSAPKQPVQYMAQPDRPQPRKDAERDGGMAVFTGRLRECDVLGYKFLALGHNTIRGAAGAAVLNAELMHSEGLLDG